MKLIVGLGNPGEKYADTRHNVGFVLLDRLREKWDFPDFKMEKKFQAELSQGEQNGEKTILAKPQTFMNLSGEAVKSIMDFYKLSPADLLVLHDELDLKVGSFKVATDSRSAGHNGVQNIIDAIGTQKFIRLRIGIGQADVADDASACRLGAHDFVLGRLTEAEREKINSQEELILGAVEKFLA